MRTSPKRITLSGVQEKKKNSARLRKGVIKRGSSRKTNVRV